MDEDEVFTKISKPIAKILLNNHWVKDESAFIQDFHTLLYNGPMDGNEGDSLIVSNSNILKISIYNENSYYGMEEYEGIVFEYKHKYLIDKYIILVM